MNTQVGYPIQTLIQQKIQNAKKLHEARQALLREQNELLAAEDVVRDRRRKVQAAQVLVDRLEISVNSGEPIS